jgi:hypothetical protein
VQIHGKRYNHLEQGKSKISQTLRGLDSVGVQIQIPAAADELQRAEVDGGVDVRVKPFQKWHRTSDVIAHCLGPGVSKVCHCYPTEPADAIETYFEAFLQSTNHYLFFFSEFELRQSFCPREHTSDDDLPAAIYLILALGAKACGVHGEDVQNGWYSRARLRLLSDGCLEDFRMMRPLTASWMAVSSSYSLLPFSTEQRFRHFIFTATLILLADLNGRDPYLEEFKSHNFNASQEGSEGGFKGGFKGGFAASAPQIKAPFCSCQTFCILSRWSQLHTSVVG